MKIQTAACLLMGLCVVPLAIGAEKTPEQQANEIYSETDGVASKDWTDYLTDEAAGSVSAAGMLSISGDSITNVENVRDLVASLKGLSSDDSKATLAISVTPGRSDLSPFSLQSYYNNPLVRLAANTTFGYAQGDAEISGTKFERQAASIETSFYFSPEEDDPVIALQARVSGSYGKGGACDLMPSEAQAAPAAAAAPKQGEPKSAEEQRLSDLLQGGANQVPAAAVPADQLAQRSPNDAVRPTPVPEDQQTSFQNQVAECDAEVTKGFRWNRSRGSVAFATGWIKPKTGPGKEESLGQTAVVSLAYGFDHWDSLRQNLQAAVIYRYSWDEPVLDSLVTGPLQEKDKSLVVFRLVGGSKRFRALLEVSDAHSDDVTSSQRTFKQAVGLDVRLHEATWLNLRVGRQSSVDGTDDETGSVVSISYSPTALLKGP